MIPIGGFYVADVRHFGIQRGAIQGPDVGYVIAGVRTDSEKDLSDASLWFTRVLSDLNSRVR